MKVYKWEAGGGGGQAAGRTSRTAISKLYFHFLEGKYDKIRAQKQRA